MWCHLVVNNLFCIVNIKSTYYWLYINVSISFYAKGISTVTVKSIKAQNVPQDKSNWPDSVKKHLKVIILIRFLTSVCTCCSCSELWCWCWHAGTQWGAGPGRTACWHLCLQEEMTYEYRAGRRRGRRHTCLSGTSSYWRRLRDTRGLHHWPAVTRFNGIPKVPNQTEWHHVGGNVAVSLVLPSCKADTLPWYSALSG